MLQTPALYTRWQIQVFCFCIKKLSVDCYHFPLSFMNTLRSLVHLRLQYYICLVRSIEEEQGREREVRSASNCVFSFFFFHEWEWEGERTEIAWNNWPVFLPDLVTFLAVCFYISLLREPLEGYWRSANLLPLLPPSSRWLTFPLTAAWWEVCSIQL